MSRALLMASGVGHLRLSFSDGTEAHYALVKTETVLLLSQRLRASRFVPYCRFYSSLR